MTSAVARYKVARKKHAISLWLCAAVLDDFDALLVTLLDGTRDRAALVGALARSVSDGTLQIHESGRPARDPAKVREVLAAALEPRRQQLAHPALLVGS